VAIKLPVGFFLLETRPKVKTIFLSEINTPTEGVNVVRKCGALTMIMNP
jgi:hypothetical protein